PERGLVDVDAYPPHTSVPRRVKGAEPAGGGDLEHNTRSPGDLVERHGAALRRVHEAVRVAVQHRDARVGLPGACLVAGDVRIDGRDLVAADRPDHVLPGPTLLHQCSEVA